MAKTHNNAPLVTIIIPGTKERVKVHCDGQVRIGRVADGGKWICNPYCIHGDCVIYSIGVYNDISFESELRKLVGPSCKIRIADKVCERKMTC